MFFKLALRNVKKSIKDYSIYFLTLLFGSCVFYVFNSMESQKAMLMLSESQSQTITALSELLSYVSVFIAVILGCLIVYANLFLIRRRKKEFGLYSLLGMPKRDVSLILSIETVFISIFSLVLGILIGIFVSQGISLLTAQLFNATLAEFRFVFSASAAIKTVIAFAAVFLFVMVCNIFVISRQKTIKLLYGDKKNQRQLFRQQWIYAIIFLISIVLIGYGYSLVSGTLIIGPDSKLGWAIASGALGTVLFFLSLTGFLLKIMQSIKGVYYRGLNMFTMRQISSNVNTAFISISIICLMLFFTILVLAGGFGVTKALNEQAEYNSPFDVFAWGYDYGEPGENPEALSEYLKQNFKDYDAYVKEDIDYQMVSNSEYTLRDFDTPGAKLPANLRENTMEQIVNFLSQSDFEKLQKLQGIEPIPLSPDEVLLLSDVQYLQDFYDSYFSQHNTYSVKGTSLKWSQKEPARIAVQNMTLSSNMGTVVLPDEVIEELKKDEEYTFSSSLFAANLYDTEQMNAFATQLYDSVEYPKDDEFSGIYIQPITREDVFEASVDVGVVFTFLAVYVGIIFLITAAAVLALKQLSDASDNTRRYQLLQKLGVDRSMINKAIFVQVAIYFLIPLVVALVHSIVGLRAVNDVVQILGGMNITSSILQVLLIFVVVYGGYFLATYLGCRGMNKSKN